MKRKVVWFGVCVLVTIFFSMQAVHAEVWKIDDRPDWKVEQQQLFSKLPVKPGDVINNSNWEKVKDILPFSVVNWIKKGDWEVKIGEFKYDYAHDADWVKASVANEGKYGLGKNLEVIEKSTGKFPLYVYGQTDPVIDVQNDPNAGIRIMHNVSLGKRQGNNWSNAKVDWVSRSGFERSFVTDASRIAYWNRLNGPIPNPNLNFRLDMTVVVEPYEVAGMVSLTHRPLDGSPDRSWGYVPSIRRVKKLSGANRSDPFLGSDFTLDDAGGWAGNDSSMKWKVLGEQTVLHPVIDWIAENPSRLVKNPNGGWQTPDGEMGVRSAYQEKNTKLAPWAPLNLVYIPRNFWIMEAVPLDPYYNYGKTVYYVDKNTFCVPYKLVYDKAGSYWKTMILAKAFHVWGENGKNRATMNENWYLAKDDKTDHATVGYAQGKSGSFKSYMIFEDPRQKPSQYTPEAIMTRTK